MREREKKSNFNHNEEYDDEDQGQYQKPALNQVVDHNGHVMDLGNDSDGNEQAKKKKF
jgi:hypothetical protein